MDNRPNDGELLKPTASHGPDRSTGIYPSEPHSPHSPRTPRTQQTTIPPSPILLQPLPPSSSITSESLTQSELELDRQIRQLAQERALAEALQEQQWEIQRSLAKESTGTWRGGGSSIKGRERDGNNKVTKGFGQPPQAYELYAAIDRHDIDFIMRVRDHAFGLLLAKNAGEFPIVYAARQGEKHRDVVILLIGAMSRYVNHVDEDDFGNKETRNTLKALRSNLKLAIDHALLPASSTPSLLSSYLQVLIMSEGDSFLHRTISDLSLLLRDPKSQPVHAAEKTVRSFCTKELRGVPGGVSDVEEYIANATLDLIIMSAWSLAAGQVDLERLPTHTFARDLRTWQVFRETMEENDVKIKIHKVTKRVQGILEKLLELAGNTRKSVRGRLKDVEDYLDGSVI